MFKKIIALSIALSLIAPVSLAQEMPGNAVPVVPETSDAGIPILNSAPTAPGSFMSLSDITVTPQGTEAVFTFRTDEAVHAVIEYGLTPDYEDSISTEPQTDHTETIGNLTPCARYYYRVYAASESQEGSFDTLCPVVKPGVKRVLVTSVKKVVAPVVQPVVAPVVAEETLVLNAAPEATDTLEVSIQDEGAAEEAVLVAQTPEAPIAPAYVDIASPVTSNTTPLALILFAVISGAVVILATLQKKKKWYQK